MMLCCCATWGACVLRLCPRAKQMVGCQGCGRMISGVGCGSRLRRKPGCAEIGAKACDVWLNELESETPNKITSGV